MILVDSSAWIEYLCGTGSRPHLKLRDCLANNVQLATTEVIIMEVLAGAINERNAAQLRGLLAGCELLASTGLDDYERAAALYRLCRGQGITIRSLNDCLIAAIAIRTEVPLLHNDKDFVSIASCIPLELYLT